MKARSIIKNIRLFTAILSIFFIVLVVIYTTAYGHRDLAADLTVAFSDYKNDVVK